MLNLTIDFYDDTQAAIQISWPDHSSMTGSVEQRRYEELLLFACYIIRQQRNLGNHPANRALSSILNTWPPRVPSEKHATTDRWLSHTSHVLCLAAKQRGMDHEMAEREYGQPIYLVSYRGDGVKRFLGSLTFKQQNPVFILKIKGFGFIGGILGLGAPLYAPDSVLHLLNHIIIANKADALYPDAIIGIAQSCVRAFQTNSITSLNQEAVAHNIVMRYLKTRTEH